MNRRGLRGKQPIVFLPQGTRGASFTRMVYNEPHSHIESTYRIVGVT